MIRQNLSNTEMKYRLLFDYSHFLILFFDRSGIIIECNQYAFDMLGYNEDIFQKSIAAIFKETVIYDYNQMVIKEEFLNKTNETIAYRKNQTCFNVSLRTSVHSDSQSFLGVCVAMDLTAQKGIIHELMKAEHELQLSRKTKNEFLANITHELRTPVNGIMGLIENLLETELTPKQLEMVNIIHRSCSNMNAMINSLLDYSKITSNKLVLEQREFSFRKFIKNIISVNINKISEKGLKFLVNVADDIPRKVIGDELRLTQILNNLLSNAIKFTSVGQIALEVIMTEQSEHEVELFFVVMDTGIGISLEEKDKLFRSFSQVDGSITRRFGGTGLGLYISKLLVEAMQGSISVESEKNKGSNFSFSVRLGYAEAMTDFNKAEEIIINDKLYNHRNEYSTTNHLLKFPASKEIDYIAKLLENANKSPLILQDSRITPETLNQYEYKRILGEIFEELERLMICIEMGSWVKAEEIASVIKKQMPEDKKELKNKALRLVLSVRKENHDNSLALLNELREMINEVAEWKI